MKVAIIEDEMPAQNKLIQMLNQYSSEMVVLNTMTSIEESLEWLSSNKEKIDLLFLDVELSDGKSFEVLEAISLKKPVVFTTAYDNYALQAFESNGIGYLLKPYTYDQFTSVMDKVNQLKVAFANEHLTIVSEAISKRKQRFLVKTGNNLKPISVSDISFFYAEGRTVYLNTLENRRYIVDFTLDEVMELLDHALFYRVNRSYIFQLKAITEVYRYSNSRLKIKCKNDLPKEALVSREKVKGFKQWLSGEQSQ